jgi:hypothetical protein
VLGYPRIVEEWLTGGARWTDSATWRCEWEKSEGSNALPVCLRCEWSTMESGMVLSRVYGQIFEMQKEKCAELYFRKTRDVRG